MDRVKLFSTFLISLPFLIHFELFITKNISLIKLSTARRTIILYRINDVISYPNGDPSIIISYIYIYIYSLVSWQVARSRTSMIWSTHCIFCECENVSGSLSLAWYWNIREQKHRIRWKQTTWKRREKLRRGGGEKKKEEREEDRGWIELRRKRETVVGLRWYGRSVSRMESGEEGRRAAF